jgi:hypothetical protein
MAIPLNDGFHVSLLGLADMETGASSDESDGAARLTERCE